MYDPFFEKVMRRGSQRSGPASLLEDENLTPEILFAKTPPDLTENKIFGSYNSVSEYVKTHYDLLLEDFMCPLRRALLKFRGRKTCSDILNGALIYRKVSLTIHTLKDDTPVTYVLRIDADSNTHRNTPSFGHLLVFTRDDFQSNEALFLGTVLSHGSGPVEVEIKLPRGCVIKEYELLRRSFIMMEAEAFFYVYFHVLKALQGLLLELNFPMKSYIIHGTKATEPCQPSYLRQSTRYTIFGYEGIPALSHEKWPPLSATDLDESQYAALKTALTEEVAVVQGPPGTGKTYFGVRIIKVLLDNVSVWSKQGSTPLLVVTQANQGLDNFLEGILKYTNDVVRVGDRSQNARLKPYGLKELVVRRYFETRDRLNVQRYLVEDVDETRVLIKRLSSGIIDFKILESCGVIDEETSKYFESAKTYLKWFGFAIKATKDKGSAASNLISDMKGLPELTDQLNLVGDLDTVQKDLCTLIQTLTDDSKKGARIDTDPLSLLPNDAQKWYLGWADLLHSHLQNRLLEEEKRLNAFCGTLRCEVRNALSVEILQNAKVVGLTTTGAAARREILEELKAPIVVVDEAAQVLESHVVVSMTGSCKHLILLGDHKQLKPTLTTPHLGSKFHLNISLFERLLNNEVVEGTCLTMQYRMRPEISCLLKPHIYRVLHDAAETRTRPPIRGLEKNMFFLNHAKPEHKNKENMGFSNPHEVDMIIGMSKYLVNVGYAPSEITIISMYSEQMRKLIKARDAVPSLAALEIASVDSFQGKENEIIILSLVRNNATGNIGFLKEENRICVALSRARSGLFIMGNITCLTKSSEMWRHVHQRLMDRGAIGDNLRLICNKHQEVHEVAKVCDWAKPCGACAKAVDVHRGTADKASRHIEALADKLRTIAVTDSDRLCHVQGITDELPKEITIGDYLGKAYTKRPKAAHRLSHDEGGPKGRSSGDFAKGVAKGKPAPDKLAQKVSVSDSLRECTNSEKSAVSLRCWVNQAANLQKVNGIPIPVSDELLKTATFSNYLRTVQERQPKATIDKHSNDGDCDSRSNGDFANAVKRAPVPAKLPEKVAVSDCVRIVNKQPKQCDWPRVGRSSSDFETVVKAIPNCDKQLPKDKVSFSDCLRTVQDKPKAVDRLSNDGDCVNRSNVDLNFAKRTSVAKKQPAKAAAGDCLRTVNKQPKQCDWPRVGRSSSNFKPVVKAIPTCDKLPKGKVSFSDCLRPGREQPKAADKPSNDCVSRPNVANVVKRKYAKER